jgi:hypothetical protein
MHELGKRVSRDLERADALRKEAKDLRAKAEKLELEASEVERFAGRRDIPHA